MRMARLIYLVFFPLLFLTGPLWVGAQEGLFDADGHRISPREEGAFDWVEQFFQVEAPVFLEIQADFGELAADDSEDPEYRPAFIRLQPQEETVLQMKVRLRPRGNTRRMACPLPPLKIDFSHAGTAMNRPKKLQEIKLVANCREGEVFQDFVLREYLVYKLYNLLTPLSFRVRLAKARYIDIRKDSLLYEGWAFMIEDVDELAKRNEGIELEEALQPQALDSEYLTQVAIFQFMIINLDWSVGGLHNLKIIERNRGLFPVPYDFDYAEMVGAFYASKGKDPNLPEPPSRRIYQGYCCDRAVLEAVLNRFRAQRTAMVEEIRAFSYLAAAEREAILSIVESFYRLIDRPAQVETYFVNNCRN